jgi:hypothetical protein
MQTIERLQNEIAQKCPDGKKQTGLKDNLVQTDLWIDHDLVH